MARSSRASGPYRRGDFLQKVTKETKGETDPTGGMFLVGTSGSLVRSFNNEHAGSPSRRLYEPEVRVSLPWFVPAVINRRYTSGESGGRYPRAPIVDW